MKKKKEKKKKKLEKRRNRGENIFGEIFGKKKEKGLGREKENPER